MSNLVPVSDIERMALAVAKSGLFGTKTVDSAMALMLIAQAEGMHPAIAARDYHVINGKPTLKADAMLARFQAAGGSVKWLKYTDTECTATVSHPQGGSVDVTWSMNMANAAGLTKNPTWKSYPRQMLRSRVISEGIRTVFPGVAVGVYTVEEMEDVKANPQAAHMIDITPAEDEAPTDDQIAEAAALKVEIENCDTLEELDARRQRIRDLPDSLRKDVVPKAQAKAAEIKARDGAQA